MHSNHTSKGAHYPGRCLITRMRLRDLPLQGKNKAQPNYCALCRTAQVENEEHLLFVCTHPELVSIRRSFAPKIPALQGQLSSKQRFLKLLSFPLSDGKDVPPGLRQTCINTGSYLNEIWRLRKQLLPLPISSAHTRIPHHDIPLLVQ